MKRLIVMCMALVVAFAPAATAEAAKGGKSRGAVKSCVAKKAVKANKGKKPRKACVKKAKVTKSAPAPAATALARRDCRADRRLDPEGFAADFGSGADAVAKCAAELLELHGPGDDLAEDALLDDERPDDRHTEPEPDRPPHDREDDGPGNDEETV